MRPQVRTIETRWVSVAMILMAASLLVLKAPALGASGLVNIGMLSLFNTGGPAQADRAGHAIPILQSATEWNPGDLRAKWNLGLAWYMRGGLSEAVGVWKKTPGAASELILRGESSLAHGEAERALSWFDAALQVQPDSVHALKGRGDAAIGLARWDLARNSYARALELDPHTAERYSDYARTLIAGNYDLPLAEDLLKRAVELAQGSEEVYATLAGLAYARSDHEQALHWWEKAAAVAPTGSVDSLLHLATAYQAVGLSDKAIAAYQQAVREAPQSPSARLELAKAYFSDEEWSQASAEATRVVELAPHTVEAWLLLGKSQIKGGNLEQGRKALEHVLVIDPNNAEALRLLRGNDSP